MKKWGVTTVFWWPTHTFPCRQSVYFIMDRHCWGTLCICFSLRVLFSPQLPSPGEKKVHFLLPFHLCAFEECIKANGFALGERQTEMSPNIWVGNFRELYLSQSSAAWHTYKLRYTHTNTHTCMHAHNHLHFHLHNHTHRFKDSERLALKWKCFGHFPRNTK